MWIVLGRHLVESTISPRLRFRNSSVEHEATRRTGNGAGDYPFEHELFRGLVSCENASFSNHARLSPFLMLYEGSNVTRLRRFVESIRRVWDLTACRIIWWLYLRIARGLTTDTSRLPCDMGPTIMSTCCNKRISHSIGCIKQCLLSTKQTICSPHRN